MPSRPSPGCSHMVPLGVIEEAHFLAASPASGCSCSRAGCTAARRGVSAHGARRSLVGIGASLLKGGDFEEALVLAGVLALVVPRASTLYRRARCSAVSLARLADCHAPCALGGTGWSSCSPTATWSTPRPVVAVRARRRRAALAARGRRGSCLAVAALARLLRPLRRVPSPPPTDGHRARAPASPTTRGAAPVTWRCWATSRCCSARGGALR